MASGRAGRLCAVVAALWATAAAGKPAPQQATFAALRRDITVVAFFATTCAPCKKELPMVAALQRLIGPDPRVRIVAVSVDDPSEAVAAQRMAAQAGVAPALVDPALYARLFGGGDVSVPRIAVLDRRDAGLERNGALAGETTERFVREVTAAMAAVRDHAAARPTMMWQALSPPTR